MSRNQRASLVLKYLFCATLTLCVFTSPSHAGVMVSFASPTAGGGPVISAIDPETVPAVVTISIDGAGSPSISSVTSSNTFLTDQWSVSGSVSSGFNSTVVLSLTGKNSAGPRAIQRVGPGEGIGVNGANSGKIDANPAAVGEAIDIDFDASDAGLAGQVLSLVSVGAVRINAIGEDIPDLGVNDFDGSSIVIPDIANGGGGPAVPVIFPIASGATLLGGSTGQISISQPDVPPGPPIGFSLASIEFDIQAVPEPSSVFLMAQALVLAAIRQRVA